MYILWLVASSLAQNSTENTNDLEKKNTRHNMFGAEHRDAGLRRKELGKG